MFTKLPSEIRDAVFQSLPVESLAQMAIATFANGIRKAAITEIFERSTPMAALAQRDLLEKFAINQSAPIENKAIYSALLHHDLSYQFVGLVATGDIKCDQETLTEAFLPIRPKTITVAEAKKKLEGLVKEASPREKDSDYQSVVSSLKMHQHTLKNNDIADIFESIKTAIENNKILDPGLTSIISIIASQLTKGNIAFLVENIKGALSNLNNSRETTQMIGVMIEILKSIAFKLDENDAKHFIKQAETLLAEKSRSKQSIGEGLLDALKGRLLKQNISSLYTLAKEKLTSSSVVVQAQAIPLLSAIAPFMTSNEATVLISLLPRKNPTTMLKGLLALYPVVDANVDLTTELTAISSIPNIQKREEWQTLAAALIDSLNPNTSSAAIDLVKNAITNTPDNQLFNVLKNMNKGKPNTIIHCYNEGNEIKDFLTRLTTSTTTSLIVEQGNLICGLLDKLDIKDATAIAQKMVDNNPQALTVVSAWLIDKKLIRQDKDIPDLRLPADGNDKRQAWFSAIFTSLDDRPSNDLSSSLRR